MSEPIDLDKQLAECGEKAGTGNLTYGQIQAVKNVLTQAVAKARIDELNHCLYHIPMRIGELVDYKTERLAELRSNDAAEG